MKLVVDQEFKDLIPPLSAEEFKQLRENIVEDGEVREPIVTWNGVILDGHNRWAIIQENPNIPFKTTEMIFFSRSEAKAWMIRNQLGRRNLPNYERARLALQLKPLLAEEAKKRQGEYHGNQHDGLSQKSVEVQEQRKPIDVQKELAKIAGVSHDTIHKVDVIEQKAPDEVKEKLRKGEVSVNKAYNTIRETEHKETRQQEVKPEKPGYTLDNLIEEITATTENYIWFLRKLLADRNPLYRSEEEKTAVRESINSAKTRIEDIQKLLN